MQQTDRETRHRPAHPGGGGAKMVAKMIQQADRERPDTAAPGGGGGEDGGEDDTADRQRAGKLFALYNVCAGAYIKQRKAVITSSETVRRRRSKNAIIFPDFVKIFVFLGLKC